MIIRVPECDIKVALRCSRHLSIILESNLVVVDVGHPAVHVVRVEPCPECILKGRAGGYEQGRRDKEHEAAQQVEAKEEKGGAAYLSDISDQLETLTQVCIDLRARNRNDKGRT